MNTSAFNTVVTMERCRPGPTRRLLLVDDDEALRTTLDQMVQGWAYATTTAGTFREARQTVLAQVPFTVVVCDFSLPDGDGLEFHDWLKREMQIEVPFLLISGGVPRPPAATDEYEFLAKPFRMEEFRTRLEHLCYPSPPLGGG